VADHRNRRDHPVTIHRFLNYHRSWAQETANVTGTTTNLHRDREGAPHLTIPGWPIEGEMIASFEPKIRKASEPYVVGTESEG